LIAELYRYSLAATFRPREALRLPARCAQNLLIANGRFLRAPLHWRKKFRQQIKSDQQSKRPQQVTLGAATVAAKRAKYYEKKEVKPRQEIFSNWLSKCFDG
jgi:hypothetical protein